MSTPFSYFFQKINHISPLEHNFTEVLDTIALKPKTLYFYGKMPKNVISDNKEMRPKTVAIVGTRHNTKYGEEIAYKLSYELAKRGVIIVSGLAYGIDSIAHRATLDAGGTTVAVLGTPISQIYPKSHENLAKEIIGNGGVVMSEYAPDTKVFPKVSFLERNRIISGLSDVVVVIEAAERSGSLNTAAHALDQGKELFAVPGDITKPFSQGCNKLIKQGANPYTGVDDVLNLLFPAPKRKKRTKQMIIFGDTEEETQILKLLTDGVRDGEKIMEQLKMPVSVFNQTITMMEIKGMVKSLGMNKWMPY